MTNDFMRVSAVSPMVSPADVKTNVDRIMELVREASASGAEVVVTPEMSLTGYTCADLFNNELLQY